MLFTNAFAIKQKVYKFGDRNTFRILWKTFTTDSLRQWYLLWIKFQNLYQKEQRFILTRNENFRNTLYNRI